MNDKLKLERYLLEQCKLHIGKKLRWASSEHWTHGDFQKLSELIFNETNIQISHNTLKRIWGKLAFEGMPNQSTRDALAKFAGFADWEDLRKNTPTPSEQELIETTGAISDSPKVAYNTDEPEFLRSQDLNTADVFQSQPIRRTEKILGRGIYRNAPVTGQGGAKTWSMIASLVMLAVLLWAAYVIFFPERQPDFSKVEFSAENAEGYAPHSVIFKYDISEFGNDTVKIKFKHDDVERVLRPGKDTVVYSYYMPNYYSASLVWRGKEVKKIKVQTLTKDWQIIAPYSPKGFKFPHIITPDSFPGGVIRIDSERLKKYGVDLSQEFFVDMRLVKDFNVSADDLSVEALLKNAPEDGAHPCQNAGIMLLCENGVSYLTVTGKGCASTIINFIGDTTVRGDERNLIALERNLSTYRRLKIKNSNLAASMSIDDTTIYKLPYVKPLGNLKGLIVRFKGTGSMDWIKLRNGKGEEVYSKDF